MPEGLTGLERGKPMEPRRGTAHRGKIRLHAVVQDNGTEQALQAASKESGDVDLVVLTGSLPRHLERLLQSENVDMLFVEVNLEDGGDMAALNNLVSHAGARPIVVTSKTSSVEAMRLLVRMPLADFLPQPMRHEDLVAALRTARHRPAVGVREGEKKPATVLTFIRPSGGIGATTLAIQTAYELANPGGREKPPTVLLVDLDFQSGNVAIYLDLEPTFDMPEISRFPQRLDPQLLRAMATSHTCGIEVLAAPNQLLNHDAISSEILGSVLGVACEMYDYVVIDLPLAWTQWASFVLSGSDVVFLVSRLTYPTVRQTRQLLLSLGNVGLGGLNLVIVGNRHPRQFWQRSLSQREAERAVARKIDFVVPDEERLVLEAINRGVPLREVKRNSGIAKAVRKMVRESLKRVVPIQAMMPKE
jgi:pilus assembly protein CpaE